MQHPAASLPDGECELVTFRVGEQDFCIDIVYVREIRRWTPATILPHAPAYVLGVINLRGAIALGDRMLRLIDIRAVLPPTAVPVSA